MMVIGFFGGFGAGKTAALERRVAKRRSVRVSVAGPARHPFDIGHPGKRTFRHSQAAALARAAACRHRFALPRKIELPTRLTVPQAHAPWFAAVNQVLIDSDQVLDLPKTEVWRAQPGKPAHCRHDVFIDECPDLVARAASGKPAHCMRDVFSAIVATVLPAALSACWLSQGQRGRKAFHP